MIHVEGLTKYYGEKAAIRNLSFSIQAGEVIGFLGLNGAGKSTTLRVLGCVLSPTYGKVVIGGDDVIQNPHAVRKRIGFLPDTPPLYEDMAVKDYLCFVAELRGVARGKVEPRVNDVLKQMGLMKHRFDFIRGLSFGYRQRVGLAQALVHNPKFLILDEPMSGLDPMQIIEIRALIKKLKGQHTIMLSSHLLSETSQVCDRHIVIQHGEVIAMGTEEELSRLHGAVGVTELEVRLPAQRAIDALRGVASVTQVTVHMLDSAAAKLRIEATSEVRPELVKALVAADIDVLSVTRAATHLESIFSKIVHEKKVA